MKRILHLRLGSKIAIVFGVLLLSMATGGKVAYDAIGKLAAHSERLAGPA